MQEPNQEVSQQRIDINGIGRQINCEFLREGKMVLSKNGNVCDPSSTIEKIKKELESILDAITDPIFIHDKDLKIIRANKAYCEAAGLSFQDVIGKRYFNVFPLMDTPFKKCVKAHELQEDQEEVFIATLDKLFKVKVFPIKDGSGSYMFSVHVMEDITDRREAEDRIRAEAEISRALLNVSASISTVYNRDEMLRKVMEVLRVIVNAERFAIFLWDKEQEAFLLNQSRGFSPGLISRLHRFKFNSEIPVIKKLLKGEMVSINDALMSSLIPSEIVKTCGMKSVLYVPINTRDKVTGFITAERSSANIPFEKREEVLLYGLSNQIAIAIENIGLYKDITDKSIELSQRVETLKIMHEIDINTLSMLEEPDLMETLIKLVSRIVNVEIIIIAVSDYERKGFVYKVGYGLPLDKDTFFSFSDTYASEVIQTGRYKFIENINIIPDCDCLPFQKMLKESGYCSGIIFPLIAKGKIVGVFHVGSKKAGVFTTEQVSILDSLASQIAVALANMELVNDIKDMFLNLTRTLSNIIDAKSQWTGGHSERVTQYAMMIAGEMGFSDKDLKDLELAGLLHDIGKVGTYDSILDKPGKLTDEELSIMREHPGKGADILKPIKQLNNIIPVIKHHHEYYNGKGYPDGLIGRDIPLPARILTVADTVDAMSADRPYRKGKSMEAITKELIRCSGSQFDPEVVDAFMKIRTRISV